MTKIDKDYKIVLMLIPERNELRSIPQSKIFWKTNNYAE